MSQRGLDPLRVYIINQTVHWLIVGLIFPVLVLFILEKGLDMAMLPPITTALLPAPQFARSAEELLPGLGGVSWN